MREIKQDEVYKLGECLKALAMHHNSVSQNFKGHYPKTPIEQTIARFADEVKEQKAYIAVTENDGKVTGFCKVNAENTLGVIEYLIVLESQRGQGLGAQLMDWALDKLDSLGVEDIDVKVADGNNAVSLYERYGFKMNAHILRLCR